MRFCVGENFMARIQLTVVPKTDRGVIINTGKPEPVIKIAGAINQYECGSCGAILMFSNPGQVKRTTVVCGHCHAYNATET